MDICDSSKNQSEKDVIASRANRPILPAKSESPLKKVQAVRPRKGQKPKPPEATDGNEMESWFFTHI